MLNIDNDQIGKIGEKQFDVECLKRNLFPSWPSCDKNGYDCLLDNGNGISKIQIKSSNNAQIKSKDNRFYKIIARKGKGGRDAYTKGDFDYLVICLIPEDSWYIIPFKNIMDTCISIYVKSETSKWAPYKNAWHLLTNHSA